MNIQLLHLSKKFEDNQLFQDLNITFQVGRVNCLMGPSGSGKTTIINILMGLMKPDSGEIRGLEGIRIATVFQEDRLIEHWNSVKNIRLICDKTVTKEKIEQELLQVGLGEYKDKPVKFFSGGMRRRVTIVRAMLAKSNLIILDEPFKGLDEALKLQVIEYVKTRAKGKTVILVTHDKEEAEQLEAILITLSNI